MKKTTNIDDVISSLNAGGVALLPTDTVFGLAAKPEFPLAEKRIYDLKSRPAETHLPVMVSSRDQLAGLGVVVSHSASKLLRSKLVPGAITLVFGVGPKPPTWLSHRTEVAVRIPANDQLLEILRKVGPLLVTSANRHGNLTSRVIESILAELNGRPDVVLLGSVPLDQPSTVVNCRLDPPVVERVGAISPQDIEAALS